MVWLERSRGFDRLPSPGVQDRCRPRADPLGGIRDPRSTGHAAQSRVWSQLRREGERRTLSALLLEVPGAMAGTPDGKSALRTVPWYDKGTGYDVWRI